MTDLASLIRDVPDFPQPGIVFKDIMPLLADPAALRETIERIAEWADPKVPDLVLGAEARGYITGGALACRLNCGFVAARKPGKLPWRTVAAKYALEYGIDSLEVHADAIVKGQRVLIHDDVLVRDEVQGEPLARRAADGKAEPLLASAGCEEEERRREHRARPLLRVAEEAPRPLARLDPPGGEVAELESGLLQPRRHQIEELSRLEPEWRPVELVVGDEPRVLLAAGALEADAVDGGVPGTLEPFEATEGRQRDRRLAPRGARERVPRRQNVVHRLFA